MDLAEGLRAIYVVGGSSYIVLTVNPTSSFVSLQTAPQIQGSNLTHTKDCLQKRFCGRSADASRSRLLDLREMQHLLLLHGPGQVCHYDGHRTAQSSFLIYQLNVQPQETHIAIECIVLGKRKACAMFG